VIFDWNFWNFGACDIPLEKYFQDLSNCISHAPKFQKFQSKITKEVASLLHMHAQNRGKKTTLDVECSYFLPCFVIVK